MSKDEKKTKEESKEKKPDNPKNEILEAIGSVVKTVKDLSFRMDKLENPITPKIIPDEQPVNDTTDDMPVPSEYRIIIDDVLNKKFGIEVEASTDVPTFNVTIIVPEEYSNLPQSERDVILEDKRTKAITYAEGAEGVKMWANKIYSNFSQETKAKITQDRNY